MKFVDLAGFLGLLLAIGAALDFSLRQSIKQKVVRFLERVRNSGRPDHFSGSLFLTKIFGTRLLSRKAIPRYVLISLISLGISIAFAYLSSPPEVKETIWFFPKGSTWLAISIMMICMAGGVLGDVLSYAQTRIFVEAVDRYRSATVAIGLAFADIIISLSIFLVAFSFVRLICYLIAMSMATEPPLSERMLILQAPLSQALSSVKLKEEQKPASFAFAQKVASATEADLRSVPAALRAGNAARLKDPERLRSVAYGAELICLDGPNNQILLYKAVVDTQEFSQSVLESVAQAGGSIPSQREVASLVGASVLSADSKTTAPCATRALRIETSLSARGAVAVAGIKDSYLASLERTFYDGYQLVGFKLAPYVYFDPFESMGDYLASVQAMARNTFLGALPHDLDKEEILGAFEQTAQPREAYVRVPFSPLVASALTTSLFFWIYLLFLFTAKVRQVGPALVRVLMPNFNADAAVFTSISVVLALSALAIYGVLAAVEALWSNAFG